MRDVLAVIKRLGGCGILCDAYKRRDSLPSIPVARTVSWRVGYCTVMQLSPRVFNFPHNAWATKLLEPNCLGRFQLEL